MLGGFGPSIVGFYKLYIKANSKERKEFLDRLFNFNRIGIVLFIIALLIYPIVFGVSVLIDYIFVSNTFPEADKLQSMLTGVFPFISNTVVILLLGPVTEEIGWRGYLLDKLQSKLSVIKATIIIGIIWWAWHIPLFFMPSTLHGSQGLFSFFTIGYFFTVLSYSIIFTWFYNNSNRSILIAILAHFSINFIMGTLVPFSGAIFIISTILLLLIGIGLYLKDKNLGMK